MTTEQKISKDIETIKRRAGDPIKFRGGLAKLHGVDVSVVDSLIAASATAIRIADPETIALERLADERKYARTHRAEYREANHEED